MKKMQRTALLAACLTSSLPTFAGVEAKNAAAVPGYQMAAITDQAYGDHVLAGDYGTAIARLSGRSRRFEARTNLCVAYALSGELEAADRACADALAISERRARDGQASQQRAEHRDLAIALSNHGVVRAMRGDLLGALANFARAVDVQDELAQARNNLHLSMAAASSVLREVTREA